MMNPNVIGYVRFRAESKSGCCDAANEPVPIKAKRPPTGAASHLLDFKRADYAAYAQNARTLIAMRAAPSNTACHVGL